MSINPEYKKGLSLIRKLVKEILNSGYLISVHDGEVWEVKKSANIKEIMTCVDSVEECTVRVWTNDNTTKKGSIFVIPSNGEDFIVDHTDNEYLNNLLAKYFD